MANGGASRKDVWDKLDIIVKGVLALVVSVGVTYYSTVVQTDTRKAENERQRKSRESETLIRLFNQREESNSNLRSKMFDTLLNNFFKKGDAESKIVALQMIGLNFRNTLQIKPMFNQLDRELTKFIQDDPDNKENKKLRKLLHKSARAVIRDQLTQIENAAGGSVCKLTLNMMEDEYPKTAVCLQDRGFILESTGAGEVRIQAYEIDFEAESVDDSPYPGWKPNQDNFTITYYDMPMIDFTRLTDTSPPVYYSLVANRLDFGGAELRVAVLPTADYSSRNPFKFDELVSDIFTEDSKSDSAGGTAADGAGKPASPGTD